jgi:hypothetical protein
MFFSTYDRKRARMSSSWYKISLTLEDIPEEHKGGDCYEAAGRYVMDNALFPGDNPNLILVHGEVTGQGPIAGVKFGHAWVEDGDLVRDYSRDRKVEMPKIVYYALGNIEESKVFKYTPEEMRRKILDYEHWGPWDLQTEF